MSLKKRYLKSKPVCKVTFRLSKDETNAAETANLVGEFNNWDTATMPMSKTSAGNFSITLDLNCGKDYQYKYLLNGNNWLNDPVADRYVPVPDMGTENSVVVLDPPAQESKPAAPKSAANQKTVGAKGKAASIDKAA